jgi:hypothetical protein
MDENLKHNLRLMLEAKAKELLPFIYVLREAGILEDTTTDRKKFPFTYHAAIHDKAAYLHVEVSHATTVVTFTIDG